VPALLILIVVLFLLFNPNLLPRLGSWLGGESRKPYRHAKWVWSSLAGTEDELIRAERDYGEICAHAFVKQFSGSVSRADQEFASALGTKLSDAVKDRRREFHVTVLAASFANAFALPGGFVFITQPLLELCGHDKNEIAFFLGHEIGHILRGHAKDHLTATAFLNAVMSRLPVAGRMLREVVSKGYSRALELEADQEGVRLAAAAGFDARASIPALKRMAQISAEPSGLLEYVASHPPIAERIRELEKHFVN
jgi:beta-barrel assembly-enhancing protease